MWALFSLLFIFMWNRMQWLDNVMFIITLECSKLWIWMGIYFREILHIRISRGANNCVQCIFEKKYLFQNDIPPHFKFLLSNERLDLWILKENIKKIHSHLWSYLPRVSIYWSWLYVCIYIQIFWLFYQVRGIIQNACYWLFSTDLNKIFHIKYVYM